MCSKTHQILWSSPKKIEHFDILMSDLTGGASCLHSALFWVHGQQVSPIRLEMATYMYRPKCTKKSLAQQEVHCL